MAAQLAVSQEGLSSVSKYVRTLKKRAILNKSWTAGHFMRKRDEWEPYFKKNSAARGQFTLTTLFIHLFP
jgi:hypothetical protein